MTKLDEIKEKYSALETRQRFMVLGAIAAVLLLLFELTWFRAEQEAQQKLKRETATVITERDDLLNALQQRQQEIAGAALSQKRQSLERLRNQERQVDAQLQSYAHLVSPNDMPVLLQEFFESSKKLKLISLETLPAKIAFSSVNDSEADKSTMNFFKHDFQVRLTGRYLDILDTLERLEQKDLSFYWQSLDYDAAAYPKGDVTLTLYTYSYDEFWISS